MKDIIRKLLRARSSEQHDSGDTLNEADIQALQNRLDQGNFEFKPFFAGRVMHQIQQKTEEVHGIWINLPLAFRWVITPAMTLIIGLVVYSVTIEGSFSLETLLGIQEVYLDDLYYEFSTE